MNWPAFGLAFYFALAASGLVTWSASYGGSPAVRAQFDGGPMKLTRQDALGRVLMNPHGRLHGGKNGFAVVRSGPLAYSRECEFRPLPHRFCTVFASVLNQAFMQECDNTFAIVRKWFIHAPCQVQVWRPTLKKSTDGGTVPIRAMGDTNMRYGAYGIRLGGYRNEAESREGWKKGAPPTPLET